MEIVILPSLDEAVEIVAGRIERWSGPRRRRSWGWPPARHPSRCTGRCSGGVEGGLDLSRVRGFALDEYVGLDRGDERSYAARIDREVTRALRLDPRRVRVPDGAAADLPATAAEYERAIADAGGVDLQILGIGMLGHLGSNEPGSSLASRTRVKTLTEQTRRDDSRFFDSLEGSAPRPRPRRRRPPASALQLHPAVTVYLDEAAAGRLELAEYYRYTYEHEPAWQRTT